MPELFSFVKHLDNQTLAPSCIMCACPLWAFYFEKNFDHAHLVNVHQPRWACLVSCQVDSLPPPASNTNKLTPVNHQISLRLTLLASLLAVMLAACSSAPQATVPATTLPAPQQVTPSPTVPVAVVNGEPISAESFSVHLAQYQAAQAETGTLLASENIEQLVLEDLISMLLLAQVAREEGFALDEATIDQRLASVIEQAGGQPAFDAWLAEQGYTAASFRQELGLEIEAGWLRARLTEAVPVSAEQVLARQILLTDRFQAERLLGQLEGGTTFEQVARNNDTQALGYLGWFPREYLLQPEVEEAAFGLQPGEYSGIVETGLGFHLIEVLDRDPDRPLNPQARLGLQMQTLADWLAERRAQSTIEISLP